MIEKHSKLSHQWATRKVCATHRHHNNTTPRVLYILLQSLYSRLRDKAFYYDDEKKKESAKDSKVD